MLQSVEGMAQAMPLEENLLIEEQLVTDIEQASRFRQFASRMGRLAARFTLSIGLAMGSAVAVESLDPEPAAAAAETGGYPDTDAMLRDARTYTWWKDENGNDKFESQEDISPRGYAYRNCTDWAAFRAEQITGEDVPWGLGNGKYWNDKAPSSWVQDTIPEPGDIAQSETTDPYGHVGVVEKVNKDAQGKITSIEVSEYNKKGTGLYSWTLYTPDANGTFWRASGKKWDHFLDLNGTGKGINDEDLTDGGQPAPDLSPYWSGNSIASWGPDRLDVFAPSTNENGANTKHLWYGSGWRPWEGLPLGTANINSWPAAVSWGPNRLDLFARGGAGGDDLLHSYYDENGWHEWYSLADCIGSAPGVSSWGPGRLDVFVKGCGDDNSLKHRWYSNGWQSWETLPLDAKLGSAPTAVSWGENRIDVVARDVSNGRVMHAYFAADGWHNWGDLGGCVTGTPNVSSWGPGRLDIFAMGCRDQGWGLNHKWFNGSWQPWETVPTGGQHRMTTSPSAVSWGQGRIDVVARNQNGDIVHTYFDANGWHNWLPMGGAPTRQ